MAVNQELKKIISEIKYELNINQTEIADRIGVKKSYLSDMINGRISFTDSIREKLNELRTYKVEKYINEYDDPVIPYSGDVLAEVVGGDGVYYPNVVASGGFDFATLNVETERMSVNVPQFEKGLIYINVYGDSMSPRYNSGDVIGIKQIEPDFILYGYPYVVVLTNGDVHIKIIKKGKGEDSILLVSENEYYEPKEFRLELFKQFFVVKGVIKKEMM